MHGEQEVRGQHEVRGRSVRRQKWCFMEFEGATSARATSGRAAARTAAPGNASTKCVEGSRSHDFGDGHKAFCHTFRSEKMATAFNYAR